MLTIGNVLQNRYRVETLLGQGGMGAVYKVWDLNLNLHVAIKENLDYSTEAQRQFGREANILARLTHSHLPRVTDYFFLPGRGQYLVMDYVGGEDLQTLLERQGQLPEQKALAWIAQVCDALAYLHSQNPPIVHRDVKPANIKVTPEGKAMLVDFGIAKVYDQQLRTTMGARAVTPGYSPPEQYGLGRTTPRSDVYAVGATLYVLLTEQDPPESVERMAGGEIVPPRRLNRHISPETEAVILRAMMLDSRQRYADGAEAQDALLAEKAGQTQLKAKPRRRPSKPTPTPVSTGTVMMSGEAMPKVAVPEVSVLTPPRALARKKGWIWGIMAAVVVLVFLASVGFPSLWEGSKSAAPETSTPFPYVLAGTPVPKPVVAISPENMERVVQLAYWEESAGSSVVFSPDGQTLASGLSGGVVQLWQVSDGSVLHILREHTGGVTSVAFSPDGATLASGSADNTVRLWGIWDGSLTRTLEEHKGWVNSVVFSPDGATLASGSADNTVRLWQVSDGALLHTLEGHTDGVTSVAFSPDGVTLASGSADNTVRLWRVSDGALLRILEGHTDGVSSVAFSPDRQTLASGSEDTTVRLWRVSDGALLHMLGEHMGSVRSVAFSPDGTVLASGSYDGTVRLWGVR